MPLATADLEAAALQQPGAVRRHHGIKFQCPACAAEGHDEHQDNACLFSNGSWGCAWSKDTDLGRVHWEAIGRALGAFSNGVSRSAVPPPGAGRGLSQPRPAVEAVLAPALVAIPAKAVIEAPPPVEIVQGIAWAGAITLAVAESGAGKTFVALALAGAVSEGERWCGRRVRQGSVVYLSYEGDALGLRLLALRDVGARRLEHPLRSACP
jgi:hypothetical protein